MRVPTRPIRISVQGLAGANRVRFLATIRHGTGTRDVAVDVPPEVLLRIAECLTKTADGACGHPRDPREGRFCCGHAVWHYDHPEDVLPCVDGSRVLDVGDAGGE